MPTIVTPQVIGVAQPITVGDTTYGVAQAGLSQPVVISSNTHYDQGKGFNYTLVVQIPVPFLNLKLNFNLLADFILPILSTIGVPQAITWLMEHITDIINVIVEDVQWLLLAIPEATVTILVKVGPAVVINIQLMAKRQPVKVSTPTFQLALPNFAIDPNFNLALPFPVPPPVIITVPIPIPVVKINAPIAISGGNVNVSAGATVTPQPFPITNPITFPKI